MRLAMTKARRPAAVILGLAALALAGCEDTLRGPGPGGGPYGYAPPPPPPPPSSVAPASSYDAHAFAWSVGQGPGMLSGRVAYRAVSGDHWTCQGQVVALIPTTRYSAARMLVLYGSQDHAVVPKAVVQTHNAQTPGVDYGTFVRTSTCSVHDGFGFNHLPVGTYFLVAGAHPHGEAPGPNEGVVLMQRVDVAPGPTRIVVPQP